MTGANRLYSAFAETFRAAIAQERLLYPRCAACGRSLGLTARLCECGHRTVEWLEASGEARLLSYATYQQRFSTDFEPPYTVVQIELTEGPRLTALWADDHTAPQIGMPLRLLFDARGRLAARSN